MNILSRIVTIEELRELASEERETIWEQTREQGREPKIYMHWSAGHYNTVFDDYHINIAADGTLYLTGNLSDLKAHTYHRNTGAVGVSMCCAYGANTSDLGDEPPTAAQIEAMAQAVEAIADGLWLTIDMEHVMTHGEAADNVDGIYASDPYGPQSTTERWDLQYLGTSESPYYTTNYDDEHTGGNVLRGKANWYRNQRN